MNPKIRAHISKVACSAWKRLQLQPPADLRAVCDFLEVEVVYQTPPMGSRGLWVTDGHTSTIYICPELPHRLQRLVWAHEIGHAIFKRAPGQIAGDAAAYGHDGALEQICDFFGRNLLAPDTALSDCIQEVGHCAENDRTALMASIFGVSYELMRRRLREYSRGMKRETLLEVRLPKSG